MIAQYSLKKQGDAWQLIRSPSALVATVYYQNRAEEIRDAMNDRATLLAALKEVREASKISDPREAARRCQMIADEAVAHAKA